MNTLDIFRYNTLAITFCDIEYTNSKHIRFALPFVDYFDITTHKFIQELELFENTNNPPAAYNANLLQIYTNYYACLEQYINTLYMILHFYIESNNTKECDYKKFFKLDCAQRINKIIKILGVNKVDFQKTGLVNKINELGLARNYILHGNFGDIEIYKTNIPKYPLTINYEDIMEEINIILEFMNYFRYIFPNIDIMPHIIIRIKNAFFYKKFDEFFRQVILPYFLEMLAKHNFSSTKTYTTEYTTLPTTNSKIAKNITLFINTDTNSDYKHIRMNKNKTNLFSKNIYKFISEKEIRENQGKIQLAQYMI